MERLCDDWLAAWTGAPDRLLAFYAPDATYTDPAKPLGLTGHDELAPYLTKLLARYPDWQWTRRSLHPVLVDPPRLHPRAAAGFVVRHEARIPFASADVVERCMDLVLVDEAEAIVHNEVYFDQVAWMKAISTRDRRL